MTFASLLITSGMMKSLGGFEGGFDIVDAVFVVQADNRVDLVMMAVRAEFREMRRADSRFVLVSALALSRLQS